MLYVIQFSYINVSMVKVMAVAFFSRLSTIHISHQLNTNILSDSECYIIRHLTARSSYSTNSYFILQTSVFHCP